MVGIQGKLRLSLQQKLKIPCVLELKYYCYIGAITKTQGGSNTHKGNGMRLLRRMLRSADVNGLKMTSMENVFVRVLCAFFFRVFAHVDSACPPHAIA